jgi:hypothetical protein
MARWRLAQTSSGSVLPFGSQDQSLRAKDGGEAVVAVGGRWLSVNELMSATLMNRHRRDKPLASIHR